MEELNTDSKAHADLLSAVDGVLSDYGMEGKAEVSIASEDGTTDIFVVVPLSIEYHFTPVGISPIAGELLSRVDAAVEAFCLWDSPSMTEARWAIGYRWA